MRFTGHLPLEAHHAGLHQLAPPRCTTPPRPPSPGKVQSGFKENAVVSFQGSAGPRGSPRSPQLKARLRPLPVLFKKLSFLPRGQEDVRHQALPAPVFHPALQKSPLSPHYAIAKAHAATRQTSRIIAALLQRRDVWLRPRPLPQCKLFQRIRSQTFGGMRKAAVLPACTLDMAGNATKT